MRPILGQIWPLVFFFPKVYKWSKDCAYDNSSIISYLVKFDCSLCLHEQAEILEKKFKENFWIIIQKIWKFKKLTKFIYSKIFKILKIT